MSYKAPTRWTEVPGAVRVALNDPFVKRADGVPVLSHTADLAGWRAGPLNAYYGGPRPVASLLIGAGLGSLGGYGLGRLAETVLPKKYFRENALRRRGALLGAVLGAVPGAWQAYDNYRQTADPTSVFDRWPQEPVEKAGADLFAPVIDRDAFNARVMGDPGTPMPIRAATAGLVEAASAVGGSPVVTPWDVAKIAIGAGTGLVSGVIAGKALGFLAGLTPEAQDGVMRIGLWSGLLNAVVPRALGLGR